MFSTRLLLLAGGVLIFIASLVPVLSGAPQADAGDGSAGELPSGVLLSPQTAVVNPVTGKAYVADQQHGAVVIYAEGRQEGVIVAIGSAPNAIALNSRTHRVYVASSHSGTVSVLDGVTDRLIAKVQAGPHPYVLAVDEVKNKVYVTNTFSDQVGIVDARTNAVRFAKLGSADNIVVDQHTHQVFLLSYESPNLLMWDGESRSATKIPIGEHCWGLAIDQAAAVVYVTRVGSAELVAYHEGSAKVERVHVGEIPCALAIDGVTHQIFTTDYGSNTVTVVQADPMRVLHTVKVMRFPQTLAVGESGQVYVGSSHERGISVIDGRSGSVGRTLPTNDAPFAIAVGKHEELFIQASGERPFLRVPLFQ